MKILYYKIGVVFLIISFASCSVEDISMEEDIVNEEDVSLIVSSQKKDNHGGAFNMAAAKTSVSAQKKSGEEVLIQSQTQVDNRKKIGKGGVIDLEETNHTN